MNVSGRTVVRCNLSKNLRFLRNYNFSIMRIHLFTVVAGMTA